MFAEVLCVFEMKQRIDSLDLSWTGVNVRILSFAVVHGLRKFDLPVQGKYGL